MTGWVRCKDGLPDSDVAVLLWNGLAVRSGVLDITDDSEGHGEPYWETTDGPLPIGMFTHWCEFQPPHAVDDELERLRGGEG